MVEPRVELVDHVAIRVDGVHADVVSLLCHDVHAQGEERHAGDRLELLEHRHVDLTSVDRAHKRHVRTLCAGPKGVLTSESSNPSLFRRPNLVYFFTYISDFSVPRPNTGRGAMSHQR